MSERGISFEDLENLAGVKVARLGRKQINYVELEDPEKKAVLRVFEAGLQHLYKVAPAVARDIERQRNLVLTMAGVAKATFPTLKSYSFPSQPGGLGVAWLIPQALKYVATPSSDTPAYTGYKTNTWEIDLTAGSAAWILGDGTNYYKASPQTNKHSFVLIFENGLIEVASTPVTDQFKLVSEVAQNIGIYTIEPLVEIPVEDGKAIYQYPTPFGALHVDHNIGVMWGFMPRYSGKSHKIPPIGMVFYEHDFLSDLTWVS